MKSFHEYLTEETPALLTELFASPVSWKWYITSDDQWTAKFIVNNVPYICEFVVDDAARTARQNDPDYDDGGGDDEWDMSFQLNDEKATKPFALSGTGHAFQVFATVVAILKDFLRQVKPAKVYFSADETEPSRISLYNRFIDSVSDVIPGFRGRRVSQGVYEIARRKKKR